MYREHLDWTCYAYLLFCRDGDAIYIKIGVSKEPLKRLGNLSQGIPFVPERFAYCALSCRKFALQLESLLLKATRKWETRGEWRKLSLAESSEFRMLLKDITNTFANSLGTPKWQQIDVAEYRSLTHSDHMAVMHAGAKRRKFKRLHGLQALAYSDFKSAH